jgi:hypothetical protein
MNCQLDARRYQRLVKPGQELDAAIVKFGLTFFTGEGNLSTAKVRSKRQANPLILPLLEIRPASSRPLLRAPVSVSAVPLVQSRPLPGLRQSFRAEYLASKFSARVCVSYENFDAMRSDPDDPETIQAVATLARLFRVCESAVRLIWKGSADRDGETEAIIGGAHGINTMSDNMYYVKW